MSSGSGGRPKQLHHSHSHHQQHGSAATFSGHVATTVIGQWMLTGTRIMSSTSYDNSSIDSQFTDDVDEEFTVLDACIDCDDEALYDILHSGATWDRINEQDRSGRVSNY